MSGNKVYEIVRNKIIEALEQGVVPWRRPWSVADMALRVGEFPQRTPYRSTNFFLLSLYQATNDWQSPWFGTTTEWAKRGAVTKVNRAGRVQARFKQGEKSLLVVYFGSHTKNKGQDDESTYRFLRYYTVFNAEQIEWPDDEVPPIYLPDPSATRTFTPIQAGERIVEKYTANGGPPITHGLSKAAYNFVTDDIMMPFSETFESDESYYSTIFHEMGHSTGHRDRLDRDFGTRFGDDLYSHEELIAEMTSAFLMAEAGIDGQLDQSASYIDNWLRVLRQPKSERLVVRAASQAQRAADLILGR